MKTNKLHRRWIVLFSILLAVLLLPIKSIAHDRPNIDQKVSITISADTKDVSFRLYHVAELTGDVQFKLTNVFADYQVDFDLNDLNQESWKTAAGTLAGYVKRDNLPSDYNGRTDDEGNLTISNISTGLYLVLGDDVETETEIRTLSPFMISLPNLTEEDQWDYGPIVAPKSESHEKPVKVSCQVRKIWKDNHYSGRPHSIEVQLLNGNQIYEEVTLNKENNWSYVWDNLPSEGNWHVVEKKVPEKYRVTVEREGNSFIVINAGDFSQPPRVPGGKLPQTGQLWWPVPILLIAGLVLLLIGMKKGKRD